jgi:hypothetical protein
MSTTTTITLAAAGFLFLTALKFLAGAVGEVMDRNLDLTADIDLLLTILYAGSLAAFTTMSGPEAFIGMAAAFFITTVWSAIAVFRTRTLLQMTHGLR